MSMCPSLVWLVLLREASGGEGGALGHRFAHLKSLGFRETSLCLDALRASLCHLYTTPPVSAENIKHILGPQVMEGWTPSERKRVDRNFKVFKRAQVQEEERHAKKTKSGK